MIDVKEAIKKKKKIIVIYKLFTCRRKLEYNASIRNRERIRKVESVDSAGKKFLKEK